MKKLKSSMIIMAIAIMGTLFIRCQKENVDPIAVDSEVEFLIQGSVLKNSQGYNLADADKIILTVVQSNGSPTKYSSSDLKIEQMNGNYYTQKIVLKTGNYKLTEFLVLDALGETIFVTPLAGSQEAQNANSPLPIDFSVTKDVTTPVSIEVLSTEKKTPADFGLNHFPIVEVKTFGFIIGVVDSETGDLLAANLTVNSGTYSYVQNLTAVLNNVVTVKDNLSTYELTVGYPGYLNYTHTFTIEELKAYLNDNVNEPLLIELDKSTITDIEGNVYRIVKIGEQIWMAENLKTTKYNDGTDITNVTDNSAWLYAGPAYCWQDNDAATYKDIYGALYNWKAVDRANNGNRNISPTGWHVPTDAEWITLINYLGGESIAGGKLKETGTTYWEAPNAGADNSSGFSALGGGFRNGGGPGTFAYFGSIGYWWSSNDPGLLEPYYLCLRSESSDVWQGNMNIQMGFSVRCIKD